MRKIISCLILFSMIATACKKDNDPKPGNDRKALLVGTWKLTARTISPPVDWDGDGTLDTDIFTLLESCEQDNLTIFMSDGTVKGDYGSLPCDDDYPIEPGQWTLTNDGKILMFEGDDWADDWNEEGYTISQLDEHTLKLQVSLVERVTYTVTWTFTRQ
ncbi:MAG: lipocalin family protein [Chitinophagaceae bacterium]|nr:lipocalin family protein [Chitinophagaceae bacterium]